MRLSMWQEALRTFMEGRMVYKNKFALLGAAGFVAPRHMMAIKNNDGVLLAAVDPFDSVGVIDSFFPDAYFFTEIERF